MSLAPAFAAVRERMAAAAVRGGRRAEDVSLVAVSKTVEPEVVREAQAECGQQLFGENRADELVRKVEACPDADFHFIGTLQTNKVRKVVGRATLIHSVDSQRLLQAIDARAALQGIVQPVLLQIDISGEEAKHGIKPDELDALLHFANSELHAVRINGLMTMAPATYAEEVRWVFEGLRELEMRRDYDGPNVALTELSMGMSGDYEVAIEEGATLVRIGTSLFGTLSII